MEVFIMKQVFAFLPALKSALLFFLFLPGVSLTQTNFVKYAGNPILPLGNTGNWDDTEAAYATVLFDGTIHQMWYSGAPQEDTYRIGYATSTDGLNWIKDATNPVLGLGAAGTFDSINLWLPAVLFDGSQYEMWYSGGLTASGIGFATSPDPVSWSRPGSGPVLAKGSSGAWDESYAFRPVVLRSDTLYHMWYTGRSASDLWQTGYATSTFGITWDKHSNNPVLPIGAAGTWEDRAVAAGSILFEDGQYQMWYHGARNNLSDYNIGYATSPDGINWTKHPNNPILKSSTNGWDLINVGFPCVIKEGNRYRMWYTGRRSGSIDRLGYAEDFSKAAHVDSIRVSSNTVSVSDTVFFDAYIANPHTENLTAQARIKSNDGSVSELVDLTDAGNNVWQGQWVVPADGHDYSAGVSLNNLSAGYVHNSFDWGIFDEFSSIVTSLNDDTRGTVPAQFALHQNYPNPFNPTTTIEFSLPKSSFVMLQVYNLLGTEVATLLETHKPAGKHVVSFDAMALASGIYYYTLTTGDFKQSRKMLLLR
ncbi:MAG: T9SS C-terminal target domain-containing protein [Calditrichaeota bacterium]|nr:MAG: T9SS C-terminal target domain-containing protein [Calditrichota bacterium]